MAALPAVFVLFLLNGISGYALTDNDELVWPKELHYKGENFHFGFQLDETIEVWYSSELKRTRIDYYGGASKTYYYNDEHKILNVFPISSVQNMESQFRCLCETTDEGQPIFLPNTKNLVYSGLAEEEYPNAQVELWQSEYYYDFKKIVKNMVYVTKNEFDENVPVRQIYKELSLDDGSVMRHIITDYYKFSTNITESDVSYEDYNDCCSKDKFEGGVDGNMVESFNSYTSEHKKNYSEHEHQMRKTIFQKNLRHVEEVNKQNLGYKLILNEFADRTEEELSYLTAATPSQPPTIEEAARFPYTLEEIDQRAEQLPENFDLRMKGLVSRVKDQATCGSCWAFASVGAVEGALAKTNDENLMDLSEQSLIDCAWEFSVRGCNGGNIKGALKYITQYGIPTEEQYGGYKATPNYCHLNNVSDTRHIRGYHAVTPRHPNALKVALYEYGPVAVMIHSSKTMQLYSSGVFYDFTCFNKTANHAVLVVGYGVRDSEDYWIVKNSWGESWGMGGYILMSARDNNCLLLDEPYNVIL